MKHRGWIILSGFIWFMIGSYLLYKGLFLFSEARFDPNSLSVLFGDLFGSPSQASMVFLFLSLLLGFMKGRFVLAKAVNRVVARIHSLALPIRFSQVYSRFYWLLIGSMVLLGISFRLLSIPIDLRGGIDVAIGSSLVNGAFLYFRAARVLGIAK